MNKQIYPLLIAQFLSAFADNAILFTVIAMVMKSTQLAAWYVPALQSAFLVAFVVLAPWVGGLADNYPKSGILMIANVIKASGTGLLLCHVEPLIAYCVVGIGAALYSPAKYGILPELTGHEFLVKANSWIEGSTILAILLGMMVGAKVADYSIIWALNGTLVMFIASALTSAALPINIPKHHLSMGLTTFGQQMATFFVTPRSRFAILGGSLLWAVAATLRVIIVVWAPLVLHFSHASEIAELTLFLALGIIAGSMLVPKLIPLEHLRRARIAAYLMALFIVILSLTHSIWPARITLFFIGMMGGIFIVPINAALQEIGHQSIGSGSAVALQGFFENLAMLLAVGGYTFAAAHQIDSVLAMSGLGVLVGLTTLLISRHLPDNKQ